MNDFIDNITVKELLTGHLWVESKTEICNYAQAYSNNKKAVTYAKNKGEAVRRFIDTYGRMYREDLEREQDDSTSVHIESQEVYNA